MSRTNKKQGRELDKINELISKRVNALRVKKKMSMSEIGRLLGFSRNASHELMRGKSGFTPRTLYLLCSIFECNIKKLFPPNNAFKVTKKYIGDVQFSGNYKKKKYELIIK